MWRNNMKILIIKNVVRSISICCVAVLLASCTKNSHSLKTPPNVYVVGSLGNNGVLWNNGSTTYLADTSAGLSEANAVFIVGNDIYIGGEETYQGDYTATIWINGVPSHQTSPAANSFINALFVSGSDTYAVGEGWNTFGGTIYTLYWKDGSATILDSTNNLPANNPDPSAISVFVSGGNVYIGGNNQQGGCYWVNGLVTNLNSTLCSSIFASGSDVFVVGNQAINSLSVPTYWKNGMPVTLPAPSTINAYAQSIFISGSDVYVAGYQALNNYNIACFWKNGVAGSLQVPLNSNSYLTGVYVSGADVYFVGSQTVNGVLVATCWKDGQAFPLSTRGSWGNSIAIDSSQ
jgi:hypothetical protein